MDIPSLKVQYETHGFVHIPNLVSLDLVAQIKQEAKGIFTENSPYTDRYNLRCRHVFQPETQTSVVDVVDPVCDISPAIKRCLKQPKLSNAMSGILGEKEISLFKDKLFVRYPGSPGYPPHQDFISWPFFPKSFFTLFIALCPTGPNNGGLGFYEGSHKNGIIVKTDGDFHSIPEEFLSSYPYKVLNLQEGDAVMFSGFVVHKSEANQSTHPRWSLYFSFNEFDDGGDLRDGHYAYYRSWLLNRYGEYHRSSMYFR